MVHSGQNHEMHAVIRHAMTTVVVTGIQKRDGPVLVEVIVGSRARSIAAAFVEQPDDQLLAPIIMQVQAYLDGAIIDFSAIPIDCEGMSEFQQAVLRVARSIPYGTTVSYSALAKEAGFPAAVRAGASVMRNNPFPLIIPCHRVIRKNGSPGAYCGEREGEHAALKQSLLQLERTACAGRRP